MSVLPKVECIKHNLDLPELGKKIKYRAFTNKEHKLVLEAIEMQDEMVLLNTILDIVDACTFKELDIQKIPTHLVDWIYLQIHIKSTGQVQMAQYTCNNVVDGEKCPGDFQIRLPLETAEIVYPKAYNESKVIMLDTKKNIGIKLKSPNFEELKKVDLSKDVMNITDHFIMTCIDSVFSQDQVLVPGADFTVDEAIEWFNELDGDSLRKISKFFKDMPYIGLSVPVTCPICKRKEIIELKGLQDFFV